MTATRADIQALRAIAVIAVVLYHAHAPFVSGGFYGVDIFFAISGYLITGILCRELAQTDRIELLRFWRRRAWRLLPNALTVLFVCLVLTATMGPVVEQANGARDITAALFYVANYWFASRSVDYFDDSTAISPVLHFWSLSVEEQFYIAWPVILLVAWSRGRPGGRLGAGLTAAAAVLISLAAFGFWVRESQPDAFFRTETRAWQLAAGALLAISLGDGNLPRQWRALARMTGLVGIAVSLSGAHQALSSPILFAVLPVAATALVLASGDGHGWIDLLTASGPLQWLGARSYSIYLWHWPILLYGAPIAGDNPFAIPALLALVLAVSGLAFAFIEQPLREGSAPERGAHRRGIGWLGGASFGVALAAGALFLGGGLQTGDRAELAKRIVAASLDGPRWGASGCIDGWLDDPWTHCLFGDARPGLPRVALVGDSYAQHLFDGIDSAARSSGWSLLLLTRASCPPVFGYILSKTSGVPDTACQEWLATVLERLKRDQPALVVISSWEGAAKRMTDAEGRPLAAGAATEAWQAGLRRFIGLLRNAGLRVVVIPSTPRGLFSELEPCLTPVATNHCPQPRPSATSYSRLTEATFAGAPQSVRIVSLTDQFCNANVCHSVRDGVIVYRDNAHHLTATFSLRLAPAFMRMLRDESGVGSRSHVDSP